MTEFHDFRSSGFREIYELYRKHHGALFAFKMAYDIEFGGLPF